MLPLVMGDFSVEVKVAVVLFGSRVVPNGVQPPASALPCPQDVNIYRLGLFNVPRWLNSFLVLCEVLITGRKRVGAKPNLLASNRNFV